MDLDPTEFVKDEDEEDDAAKDAEERRKERAESARERKARSRLNTLVAITVAVLATFMGICKVKDDNIVQAMQQAQAHEIDNYSWYQARNIREEVLHANSELLSTLAQSQPADKRKLFETKAADFKKLADEQETKKADQKRDAEQASKDYDRLNNHDDQFDLSDALLAIAISMLALTSLTQKPWLYAVALVPTFFGVLMGLAGLLNWGLHPDALTKLLS